MEDGTDAPRDSANLLRIVARGLPAEREDELVLYLPVRATRLDLDAAFPVSRWHSHSLHRQSVSSQFDRRTQMLLHHWSDGDDTRIRLIPEDLPQVGRTLAVLSAARKGVFLVVIVDLGWGHSGASEF